MYKGPLKQKTQTKTWGFAEILSKSALAKIGFKRVVRDSWTACNQYCHFK